jgi:integrase
VIEIITIRVTKMAKKVLPLNFNQIDKAKPKEKEYNLSDGDGLMLRVLPSGSKKWYFNYSQPYTKKRKALTFGSFPKTSLADARNQRAKYHTLLASKIDILENRTQQTKQAKAKKLDTFRLVAEQWFALKKDELALSSYNKLIRYFEKDVYPVIGDHSIKEITAPDGIEVLNAIIERGSYEITRKVGRALNSVMTFAVNTGLAPHNPLAGIKAVIPNIQEVNRPSLEPHELPELMKAVQYSNARVTTRCLIEFQLHTMTRPREAAEAEWIEIDYSNQVWVIPAQRMKMKKEHKIPLTEKMLELLSMMKAINGHRQHIFASHIKPTKPVNAETANKALRDMGFAGRLVAHGMRALASTVLNEQGFDSDIIEAALAHKDGDKIRAAYNRSQYLERRKIMMCWWSEHIERATTGNMSLGNARQALRIVNQ